MNRWLLRIVAGLEWLGGGWAKPYHPQLIRFMEQTGLIGPMTRLVEWLARWFR